MCSLIFNHSIRVYLFAAELLVQGVQTQVAGAEAKFAENFKKGRLARNRTDFMSEDNGLVGAVRCLEIIFPDKRTRLSLRFFRTLQAQGRIPYLKIGRRVLFDPVEVRYALVRRYKRNARR
jgi:hypothetical protein